MPNPFEIKPSPGKGDGVFATKNLKRGTTVLRDVEAMVVGPAPTAAEAQDAFDQLSAEDQQRFLSLHEGHRPFQTKVHRIYKANTFGSEDGEYNFIYFLISRVNHSCTPNAEILHCEDGSGEARLVATKPIGKGEEVTIRYNHLTDYTARSRRRKWLRTYYGFQCTCLACSLDERSAELSDARRSIIHVLSSWVEGKHPVDYSFLDHLQPETEEDTHDVDGLMRESLEKPPSVMEQTARCVLLAMALEVEGLLGLGVGQIYWQAASKLLEQIVRRDDGMVLLGAARNVGVWMEKAKSIIMVQCGTADSELRKAFLGDFGEMPQTLEMMVALEFFKNASTEEDALRTQGFVDRADELASSSFALKFSRSPNNGFPECIPISEQACVDGMEQMRLRPGMRRQAEVDKNEYARVHGFQLGKM